MSAYVVNDKTINVIASGFVDFGIEYRNQKDKIWNCGSVYGIMIDLYKVGQIISSDLLKANYDSVNYRYNENTEPHEIRFEKVSYNLGELLGCIDCFEYQSCEVSNWEDSYIYKDLQILKDRILNKAIAQLGFDIPWGVPDDEKPQF